MLSFQTFKSDQKAKNSRNISGYKYFLHIPKPLRLKDEDQKNRVGWDGRATAEIQLYGEIYRRGITSKE